MKTQDLSPLGWTGWISLQFKGLSRVLSNITVQKHQFFGAQLSSQSTLLFNMLSRLVIAFLLRSKHLFISWLQSPSAVILEPPKIKSATVSTVSPSISHEVMGPDAMILVFWMLSFKPTFSLSSFTFINRILVPLHFLPWLRSNTFRQDWTLITHHFRFFTALSFTSASVL